MKMFVECEHDGTPDLFSTGHEQAHQPRARSYGWDTARFFRWDRAGLMFTVPMATLWRRETVA